MRLTQLTTVFVLTCADCGHKTLVAPEIIKASEIAREDLAPGVESMLESQPDNEWFSAPDVATCERCDASYATHEGVEPESL